MNNNRGNNRRRGRGNNNTGRQQGGGQQVNRIDSRARGNAPQLLEKYRKLAHDSHLNGDRVAEETYLQFADHYFRVLADSRVRQDETRGRRDERWEGGGEGEREEGEYASEYSQDGDYTSYDQPHRAERPARQEERTDRPERPERGDRPERAERQERAPRSERASEPLKEDAAEEPASAEAAPPSPYEPPENPFVRENRPTRGLRPRREDRRPRREETEDDGEGDAPQGIDPATLPPAISVREEPVDEATAPVELEAKPRRPRVRRTRPPADDAGETLEAVS